MRQLIIIVFLALYIRVRAQTENIPTSIKVISYSGGDFRQGEFLGAYDQIDSLVYKWDNKLGYFISDTIYNIHEIREFRNMEFSENINKNSILRRPVLTSVSKTDIAEMLKEIDTFSYKRETFIDTLYSDANEIIRIRPIVCLVSRDYNIESYNLSYKSFKCICEQNRKISSEHPLVFKKCSDTLEINGFLTKLLKENLTEVQRTSSLKYYEITLIFKTYSITLRQNNSGGINMTWTTEESPGIRLINPKLNLVAFKLMPKYFAQRQNLLEFRENLTDKFLRE